MIGVELFWKAHPGVSPMFNIKISHSPVDFVELLVIDLKSVVLLLNLRNVGWFREVQMRAITK